MENYKKIGITTGGVALLGATGYGIYKLSTISSNKAVEEEVLLMEVPPPIKTEEEHIKEKALEDKKEKLTHKKEKSESAETKVNYTSPKFFEETEEFNLYKNPEGEGLLGGSWQKNLLDTSNGEWWQKYEDNFKKNNPTSPISPEFKDLQEKLKTGSGENSLRTTCKNSYKTSNKEENPIRYDVWFFCTRR